MQSASIGVMRNKPLQKKKKSSICIKVPTNTAPRKVLPASPIKIFAGDQLKTMNPKRHATNGQSDGCSKDKVEIEIIMHEANKPSNPSMKLQKLIIAVENTIINGKTISS